GAGNVSLMSRFGSVIEDQVADDVINVNGTGAVLTVTANSGSVQLGNQTHTSGNTTGNIAAVTIQAQGSAQVQSSGNITLRAIKANSLYVTANNIAQSDSLNIFGLSTINATNSIALTNGNNNFGPLSLTSMTSNQSVAVTESSTLNLRSVNMPAGGGSNGTFT